MKWGLCLFALAVVVSLSEGATVHKAAVNNRPIIGIVTESVDGIWTPKPGRTEYIAASYVKWVESSGARVVPVRWSTPSSDLLNLLQSINGLVLPGGGADLDPKHPYYEALANIFAWILKANDNGIYFPLWGTCLGFEEISILAASGENVLSSVDAENYTVPLNFTAALSTSRIFKDAPSGVTSILASQPVTMNNHVWGVSPATYSANKKLSEFFTVISTNVDRKGNTFLSTIEGKKYPVYGTQWHPEKVGFEWWASEVINHSRDSIIANRQTSDFLRSEAAKNFNSFPSVEEERAHLIYNYAPTYTYDEVHDFEQSYFF